MTAAREPDGITWVFEEEPEQEVPETSLGEFEEIPQAVRDSIHLELREQAFNLLHAEAVERGELDAPPGTYFDRAPGRVLRFATHVLTGLAIGVVTVIGMISLMRAFATTIQ